MFFHLGKEAIMEIFVETVSMLQASGRIFLKATADWPLKTVIVRRRAVTFCGVLLTAASHRPVQSMHTDTRHFPLFQKQAHGNSYKQFTTFNINLAAAIVEINVFHSTSINLINEACIGLDSYWTQHNSLNQQQNEPTKLSKTA